MKSIENYFIKEQDFATTLEGKVLPFLKDKIKDGYFTTRDGLRLHYQTLINPEEKAAIVISHGFCEFTTKYTETLYYFYQMGYSIFIVEHRGHGFSDRQVSGLCKIHVDRFEDYVIDFNEFIEKVVVPESITERFFLYGHSMGGAIGALYLEKYPKVFEKAVLSSPMIKVISGKRPKILTKLVSILSILPFFRKKYIWGHHDYDHAFKYPKTSCLSKARYIYQYNEREREEHYQTNGCTYRWLKESVNVYKKILKNACLVEIPVIIMQAAMDTLVVPEAQNAFAELAKDCHVIRFEGSKHEIFNATDDIILDYYTEVFKFYENAR